jgi:hypothetical protein
MTTTKLNIRVYLFLLSLVFVSSGLASCDKPEDDDDAGEQEFITKVTIRLEEQGSSNVVNIVWSDPDGDGRGDFAGAASIKSNKIYKGTITLLNELATDPKERDITKEIEEEADEHQFFYTFSSNLRPFMAITITDKDKRGMPVGLKFDLVTTALPGGTASLTGSLNVVLSHYTTITKTGTNPGNEEDINITAPVSLSAQ